MNLSDQHISIIDEILKIHFSSSKVLVFGSRVTGTNKPYSDLDIAIDTGKKDISVMKIAAAKQDFIDSDLPFSIDIVDLNQVDQTFRDIIKENGVDWNKLSSVPA